MSVPRTRDAFLGLENPSAGEWQRWYRAMLAERKPFANVTYDEATAWSDLRFRQLFLFMYDASFYDRSAKRYRTSELIAHWRKAFGRVDEVLLWHAYPRLGFDARTQFDFYREMPGGLPALRSEVSDVLHAAGIRVFVDYNPWDTGTYEELAEIVRAIAADGVMLDTMTDLPDELARAVRARKDGVLFAPELRVRDEDLRHVRQSWAQWFEIGEGPSIYRQAWLVRAHRQFAIARWDTSRRRDIVYSFFCGAGLILWENIFGTWNPYSAEDKRLLRETSVLLDRYGELFARGDWLPLIPTGLPGLDANRFERDDRAVVTLRNRTNERLFYRVANDGLAIWGDRHEVAAGDAIAVEPEGVQAILEGDPEEARRTLAAFQAVTPASGDDERCPKPRRVRPAARTPVRTSDAAFVELPGGTFAMKIVHERRECGCYPDGASDDALWGWFYKDTLTHEETVELLPFSIRKTAVTNAELLAFVHATGYRPDDETSFLKHIPRLPDGSLPTTLPDELGALPVTYVSLEDARAFAAAHGERLPTEAEWQWSAEGAGRAQRYPWGNDERSFPPVLRPAHDEATATREGVLGLSGNAWELTESERFDGHTRFVMLRGGVYLPSGESEWLPPRGARPNDWHAKYILLADGLDRSATISFRTVRDRAR